MDDIERKASAASPPNIDGENLSYRSFNLKATRMNFRYGDVFLLAADDRDWRTDTGRAAEKLPVSYSSKRRILPGDRLFEHVNTLLIMLAALGHAASLMVGGNTHRDRKPVMRIGTGWPDLGFAVPLRGPLEHALAATLPEYIEIGIMTDAGELAKQLPNAKAQTGQLNTTMAHIMSPVFLAFFDRYNVWARDEFGDVAKWPLPLNFARVIRNAAAHNGKLDIRNPNAQPASWRGLTYGPSDHGREIIGTDIKLGEILALMFDVDDCLTSIGAPVP
jgi:hypothetical protein